MDKSMRNRFFKYLVVHYENMPRTKLNEMIELVKERIAYSGYFTKDVLETVIEEMVQEGISAAAIMAHLDLLDIDERT